MKEVDYIILIDDDEPTNYYHSLMIQYAGIKTHVEIFQYAQQGLDYLSGSIGNPPSKSPQSGIVFLDLNMPGMSGWDFLEEFEKIAEAHNNRIVIFILTTSESEEDKMKARKYRSVKKFIGKPLTEEVIKDLVNTYFGGD